VSWPADPAAHGVITSAYIKSLLDAIKAPPQDTWTAPTLGASWVNFGSGYTSAGYRKDTLGRIWVRGLIKSGTTTDATVLFTLPSGYRPAGNILRTVGSNSGVNAYVVIGTDGTIKIYGSPGNTWLSIEGISFATD